jgi:hypothetical protein
MPRSADQRVRGGTGREGAHSERSERSSDRPRGAAGPLPRNRQLCPEQSNLHERY